MLRLLLFLNDVYFWMCLLFCKILCYSLNVYIILRMFLLWYLCCYSRITMLFSEFCPSSGCFSLSDYFCHSPNVVVYLLNVSVILWKFMLFANGKCYSPVVVLLGIFMLVFEFLCYSLKFFSSLNVYVIFRQVNRLAQQWCVWLTYGIRGSKPLRSPATLPQDFRSFNFFFKWIPGQYLKKPWLLPSASPISINVSDLIQYHII
jgi:hypothetical protein